MTSNLEVEQWAEYLGSKHLTIALLDRLLYRATTLSITGPSYRLAQHEKRQKKPPRQAAKKSAKKAGPQSPAKS